MVGSNGTMIAVRLVRSKLRKREDHHSGSVHPEQPAVVQTATSAAVVTETTTTTMGPTSTENNGPIYTTNTPTAEQFIWQFPPPYPPPRTPPPQYALYNDQDTLVHALPSDRPGFVKGFRKNLGGRWRRLVKRKPEMETCAIPPELKDQLKTIYVY